MIDAYNTFINDRALEIARRRAKFSEDQLRDLPVGLVLCVHESVELPGWDTMSKNDDLTQLRFAAHAHVSADVDACEWRGRREVYVPKSKDEGK